MARLTRERPDCDGQVDEQPADTASGDTAAEDSTVQDSTPGAPDARVDRTEVGDCGCSSGRAGGGLLAAVALALGRLRRRAVRAR